MGYLSEFESDVFISYAHSDNDRLLNEPQGWVEQLHADLEKRVQVHLGMEATLWRDREIRDNQEFENVILGRLVKTATFLAVISPAFVKRDWCIRELEKFAETANRSLGLRLDGDRLRIFKVEKIRVDPRILPDPLKGTGGYKFYGDREFRPAIGGDYLRSYYEKMDDLARDIADVLQLLSQKAPIADVLAFPDAANNQHRTVYVAETTPDLTQQEDEIRGILKSKGCTILPAADLPDNLEELKDNIREALSRCSLSVHLIGRSYGSIPEGAQEKSKAWVQHDLAMEKCGDPAFTRLIWVANDEGPVDVRQQTFLQYLRDDPRVQKGAEFLQKKNLTELKGILEKRLDQVETNQSESVGHAEPSAQSDVPLRVYIICDPSDQDAPSLSAMEKYLFKLGYEPVLPSENNSEQEALQEHYDNLKICDAHLIFYGEASEKWLKAKLMDFRKILSRRTEPVLAKAIYIAPPDRPCKAEFDTHEATVFRAGDSFSPETLRPFVEALRRKPPMRA